MEGLIKGLAEVALGFVGGDREDIPERQANQEGEERSRSTWAEVVSTGKHEYHEQEHGSSYGHPSNDRRARKDEEAEQESSPGHSTSWGSRKKNEDLVHEDEKKKDVDWEVVGQRSHNKKRHPSVLHEVPKENWQMFKLPPSDQTYNNAVHYDADTQPSRRELSNLSEACNKLWELDLNRLIPGKDYKIDCGEGKRAYQKGDMASGSLFKWLGDDVLRRPTYARFCSLLDNYNPQEGYKEVVTPEERHEQAAFIQEIGRSPLIKYLYNYLVGNGVVSGSFEEFKEILTHLWFDLYSRGGGYGSSSAFEHVFVGEIKGRGENAVSGFHNWIQFYLEEAKGNVDYQGYIFSRSYGEHPDSETQLLTIQFEWNGVLKSVSSTLVGVSPEFEVALYTLCFFVGREDNHVRLGPYSVNIKCYHLGRDKIGSAFPIAEC
ncbi:poly(U)-specific endoribonuclease-B-like [Phalaenopsis equestris]|uniref:poly(U)-specific endoribonuclease-B-like n=1 Tax=Phalaenopsis equestris TaxID=78828 RepID=UPI0009E417A5|nr:poly(U)-specific endoribonuclease-B-like [Phalaenopsis equestris]